MICQQRLHTSSALSEQQKIRC